ncbi:ABC transporter substrate-binding protein [Crenobacter sp. SG2305]|uniref:ABC transporter substrate-binding protein n=1 Tax=Crenobacter oryzisoli TaxID=3056844 RepID=UPI0025AAE80F|nr:ABC transporter substrate-binding protein [Crenobacter sp. SG2305]MDN0084187.1 ABC transporter substrate-binding protein [Crenobacter sp. SG2305]
MAPIRRYVLMACALAGTAQGAMARDLVVVSYGGPSKVAQAKAYYEPFRRETGVNVVGAEWNGEVGKVKAMVDTRSVSWDAVEVEASLQGRGCDEGMFEKLDYSQIGNKADFIPGAVQPCAIGTFVSSTVLAYNADKLKTAPKSWQDFWDVKRFPGKRAMRKGAEYTLEIALMADGVPPAEVYKVLSTEAGVTRAFRKLDQIKPYIQWWESGSQPAQYLLAGDVVMSTSYNGRITNARREGKNLQMVWDQSLYELDYWAIPKGSPRKAEAMKFIALASRPEQQKLYSEQMPYGPTNRKALALLPASVQAELPTAPQNLRKAMPLDVNFWIDHVENLEQRFNAWVAKPAT